MNKGGQIQGEVFLFAEFFFSLTGTVSALNLQEGFLKCDGRFFSAQEVQLLVKASAQGRENALTTDEQPASPPLHNLEGAGLFSPPNPSYITQQLDTHMPFLSDSISAFLDDCHIIYIYFYTVSSF